MSLPEKTQWLKNRLRATEPLEVFSRLTDVARHIALRASLEGVRRRAYKQSNSANRLHEAPQRSGRLEGMHPDMVNRVVVEASKWLKHRASFFGLHDVPLGEPIEWHRDYSSGVVSPITYSGSIDHRDVRCIGNVKYVWELNRLQHLVLLALASIWIGGEAHREEIDRQVLSWCAQNPFMRGVNWKSTLEAAIRLITWALVSFLGERANLTEDLFHKSLREVIYQHQYFIRNFYSKHSSANNHFIGEMAGLYIGSIFWPWYRESIAWRSFARQQLIQEMARQVEPDGVGKERATEYQLFILEFFLLAGALGQAVGDPFPQEYWQRLAHMLTFLAAISDREGNLPIFGDGDSGQVVWLPETTAERARALVRLVSPRGGSALDSNLRALLLVWGQAPEAIPLATVPKPAQNLHVFPQGGYYVLATDRGGDDEMVVVFDAGPLGLHPLYAHGHADALSFWLSYGGQEFLVDPGTFCYHTHALWRAYFRGTAAHNTIRIDGEDQSLAGGPFLWRHTASCQAEGVEDNDEFVAVEGCHDGYRRLADPVIHRRRMCLYKRSRQLVITDRLECRKSHHVEILFHFSEKCHVRPLGPGAFQVSSGSKRLCLRLDSQLTPILYHGSESPMYGWVSRTFDVKEPSFTLVAWAEVTRSTQFITEITAI
jgi:Heparinase II/III-like protein/Heparinase II/III N-terminus